MLFVTGKDFTLYKSQFHGERDQWFWTNNRLDSDKYDEHSDRCVLKSLVSDATSGVYLAGHIVKLDPNDAALIDKGDDGKGVIVPLVMRLSTSGTADIVQVINSLDSAKPFYSIDILEANVMTKRIIGLAVPRAHDLSIEDTG